ncbi:MAG: hypothetical protein ACREDS_06045 [Limisphaerales bacterium]
MKREQEQISETSREVRLDENAVCDVCGRFGAYHFGDRTLCQDCYEGCGSCCREFWKDDLWAI